MLNANDSQIKLEKYYADCVSFGQDRMELTKGKLIRELWSMI